MPAATILQNVNALMPALSEEVVRLEASDGETYASIKFSSIQAAQLTLNADNDAAHNVTFSGKTATLNIAGVTDVACTLTLYGVR